MSIDRRRFISLAGFAALAAATPALARPRASGRGSSALSLSFASFPGIGGLTGPKLADVIWSGTRVQARTGASVPVQLLAARFEGSKATAGFASPVIKLAPSDSGQVLSRLLPGASHFPDDHFFPQDLFLPGDMYLPDTLALRDAMPGKSDAGVFSRDDATRLIGAAITSGGGFRPKGLVLFAFALASPDGSAAAAGLAFELDKR